LLNPLSEGPHARFLAFRSPDAATLHAALEARNVITDVRGDVLRIGFGIYQGAQDVDRLADILSNLQL
jgi:kynureninase